MALTDLIARLAALCNNDATFTSDDYESLLLDQSAPFDLPCQVLNSPSYTRFSIGVTNLDTDTEIYVVGSTTVLTLTTDYTIDLQRGIVTTPATNYRPLSARGTTYNLNAAAADAWERIAGRYALEFDFSDVEGSYARSQQYSQAMSQAARYRRAGGAVNRYIERGDMSGQTLPNIDRTARG